jgi:hypothetical protein
LFWERRDQMSQKEIAYRITGRLTLDFQIILQAENADEAESFATDIDLDKWAEVGRDWEVLDVSKNYFLKRVKIEQDIEV